MAYIDREAFKRNLIDEKGFYPAIVARALEEMPAADVAEVVRCKDCTEWDEKEGECSHWYGFRENDFCSYGEKREDNK